MARFAEIEHGKVKYIIDTDKSPNFDAEVLRSLGDIFIELSAKKHASVSEGWSYNGKDFQAPPPPVSTTLDEIRDLKYSEIRAAYDEFDRNGAVEVSLGFPIQCGQAHLQRFDGAVRFAEQMSAPAMYITDANDVTHEDIPIADAKQALLEVTSAALKAHRLKQDLRAAIWMAQTEEDVCAIEWKM